MTHGEEQDLSRAVGRVEGKIDGFTAQMDRMLALLETKAPSSRVDDHEKRIGSLETSRTKISARSDVLKGGFASALTLLGLFIANGGHI